MKKPRVLSTPKDPIEDPEFKQELDRCLSACAVQPQTFAWNPDVLLNPSKLHDWASSFIKKTDSTLRTLYARYQISPFDTLCRIIQLKVMSLSGKEYLEGGWLSPDASAHVRRELEETAAEFTTAKLKSEKKRETDARRLEIAAALLKEWRPVLKQRFQSNYLISNAAKAPNEDIRKLAAESHQGEVGYPDPDQLLAVAMCLRKLGPSEKHRPEESQLKIYGFILAEFFKKRTGNPLYERVGILLKAAFPEKWNPASDLREAARKLVKSAL
jgi:hypothetical protein